MAGLAGQGRVVDVDTGAVRPGRVLLQRTPAAVLFLGFGPPAARLRDLAFGHGSEDGEADPVARRCRTLAEVEAPGALLKRGDAGAAFARPAAEDRAYRRLAAVEDLAKAGFDPSESRVPKGDRDAGEWTREGDNGETPVSLYPGHYIDELADFVEWIANAKPEDEKPIRREIKRLYYDVGDVQGGNALNAALSDAIEPGLPRQDRQAILDSIGAYAVADPAEMGQFSAALTGIVLAPQAPALRGRPQAPTAAVEASAAAAVTTGPEVAAATAVVAEEASEVWKLGWAVRGHAITDALRANLHRSWETIDDFREGIATSIKSIDLRAETYQIPKLLTRAINRYVDLLANYEGSGLGQTVITRAEITGRRLNLVIPKRSMTAVQRKAVAVSVERARSLGIELQVTEF